MRSRQEETNRKEGEQRGKTDKKQGNEDREQKESNEDRQKRKIPTRSGLRATCASRILLSHSLK